MAEVDNNCNILIQLLIVSFFTGYQKLIAIRL